MQSPLLGAAVRHEWMLDPDFVTINHGSFGATPRVVLAVQEEWQRRMEVQPTRFMHAVLPSALRAAAGRLAAFMCAEGKDLAFLENATVGCNAVLRSRRLQSGDEVVMLTHGYGAVRNTVRYVTELVGARTIQAAVPFPNPDADGVIAALEAAITPRTRLAVLDHITSPSALVLPLDRMVAACHAHDVPVLVDGAHGPGQVGLDLPAIGADWYVGNCHKWLCAPKGSAFIWARPDRQDGLHPVTISHGYEKGFLEEFDWTGTRDFSAFLSVPAAIDFHTRLGGEALRARNAALAAEATALIARRLNTESGATAPLAGAMGVVRLPIASEATAEHAKTLRARLLDEKTDAPLHAMAGGIWLRLSAHAYNELADYERLAEIAARVLRQTT
jgi:isopenicillin-N epimerase